MSIQVNTYTNTSCMTQTAYDNLKNYISSESLYVYDFPYWTLLTTSSSMSDFCTAQSAYWYWWSFLPDELWVMTSLTQLDLSNNSINYLSESIWNLTVLNTLSLDNNTLSELPSSIWNLSSLQELRVSNNQLSSLPSEIWYLTSLYRLELANNNLSNLPTEMTYLQLLLYLDLSNNLALWNLSYVFDYSYPMEIKIWDNLTITCWDYNNIVISPNN
jgi:Leucine-rich repeat (LRR) protein